MKLFLILPVLIISIGCNSSADKTTVTDSPNISADSNSAKNTATEMNTSPVNMGELPAGVTFKGKFLDAWKWTDNNGENIFMTSFVEPHPDNDKGESEEDGQSAEVFAAHYIKKDGSFEPVWNLHEYELSCPLDLVAEIIKGSPTITDLDKDGIAEVKVQVALACRADVSPAVMKLVMEENKMVYTLQGSRWVDAGEGKKFDLNPSNVNMEKLPPVKAGEDEWYRAFGRYESEKSFAGAPPEFLVFARNEWLKYVMEKF